MEPSKNSPLCGFGAKRGSGEDILRSAVGLEAMGVELPKASLAGDSKYFS
jgi:hypothetical protein